MNHWNYYNVPSSSLGDSTTATADHYCATEEEFEDFASILVTLKKAQVESAKNDIEIEEEGDSWSASSSSDAKTSRKRIKVGDSEEEDAEDDEKKYSDRDDYAVDPQEDEDDEWMDAPSKFPGRSTFGMRKKAASGTACEKHKRWKKRCPETCPMRDPKWKKLHHEDSRPLNYANQPWSGEEIMSFVSGIRDATRISKFGSQTNRVINQFEDVLLSARGVMKPTTQFEQMVLVRWCLDQLRSEGSPEPILELIEKTCESMDFDEEGAAGHDEEDQGVEDGDVYDEEEDEFDCDEDFEDGDGRRKRRSEDSTMMTDRHFGNQLAYQNYGTRRREQTVSRVKRSTFKSATIACEYHTSLHARCPPNCPERRPARVSRNNKRAKLDSDDLLSPQSHEDDGSQQSPTSPTSPGIITRAGRVVKSNSVASLLVLEENEYVPSSGLDVRSSTLSPTATSPTTARKNNRKYLPQACQRHRMLHARCPANCPDRRRPSMEEESMVAFNIYNASNDGIPSSE